MVIKRVLYQHDVWKKGGYKEDSVSARCIMYGRKVVIERILYQYDVWKKCGYKEGSVSARCMEERWL